MYKKDILVSIIVPTYNSQNTIVETLDSIYKQTYPNIEIIITDDDSKDKTINICKNWINSHQNRFKNTKLITTPTNTGTAGNLNRALAQTTGIWCKTIAGDDRLLPNCIEQFINHIAKHPMQRIVFAKVKGFGNMEAAKKWPFKNVKWFFDNLSFKDMKILLSQHNFLPAASAFVKKDVFDEVGRYEESIPILEDWPFWVKAAYNGIQFYFIDEFVAEYRFSENSVSQGINGVSSIYSDACNKSANYARNYLPQFSLCMRFYVWTKRLRYNGSIIGKFLFLFNIVNPHYYKFKQINRKYDFFKLHHQELGS